MKTFLLVLLVAFQLYGVFGFENGDVETKVAFVVLDENGEDFVLYEKEPPRDKVVAGATFTNSINKTGYQISCLVYVSIILPSVGLEVGHF